MPDSSVSTFSLIRLMDYCLTVRGTVGLRSTIFGKLVLTAGAGRYDKFGFLSIQIHPIFKTLLPDCMLNAR